MQLVIAGKCSAGTLAGQRTEFRQKGVRGPLRRRHPQRMVIARVVRHEADIRISMSPQRMGMSSVCSSCGCESWGLAAFMAGRL